MESPGVEAAVQHGPQLTASSRPSPTALDKRPEAEMKDGLFAVCQKPARLCDIKTFQALHNPRLHSMTEWILQYENARQRQDFYLDQIRDLRQLFSAKQTTLNLATPRRFWAPAWHSKLAYPPEPLAKRDLFSKPNETCVLFAKDLTPRRRLRRPEFWSGSYSAEVPLSSFHSVNRSRGNQRLNNTTCNSSASNRYINIVKNYNSGQFSAAGSSSGRKSLQSMQVNGARRVKLPPIDARHRKLDRHKTDYEPFERISRRNKLNLTNFLREERERVSRQNSIDLSEVRVQATPIPCSR